MLVLTRHVGEAIVINGNIHVTVIRVDGERVRLGIDAPASIRVDRLEVHERHGFGSAAINDGRAGVVGGPAS